jgi:hypothetical protein
LALQPARGAAAFAFMGLAPFFGAAGALAAAFGFTAFGFAGFTGAAFTALGFGAALAFAGAFGAALALTAAGFEALGFAGLGVAVFVLVAMREPPAKEFKNHMYISTGKIKYNSFFNFFVKNFFPKFSPKAPSGRRQNFSPASEILDFASFPAARPRPAAASRTRGG